MTDPACPPDANASPSDANASPSPRPSLKDAPREIVIATLAGAQGGLSVVDAQIGFIQERVGALTAMATMDGKKWAEVRVRQSELATIGQGLLAIQEQLAGRVRAIARARPELFGDPQAAKEEVPDPASRIVVPGG